MSSSAKRTYPKSVQPGIPRLSEKKEGWRNYLFGDLFEVIKRPANIQDNEKYRLVTVRRSRGGMANRSQLYGREISVKSQYFLRTGDFLISKRQIVHGACAIVTEDFDGAIVSNEYSVLRCKQTLLLDYFAQLSHSIYLQQTFFHSSIGVHIEKMIFKLDDWFKWSINIPSLPEQQKIATFLSAVDKKLGHLRRKHELLESYKRGVMQKIFAPFDSAQGKPLRFKQEDGTNFPDWEEKRLGDVCTFFSGGTPTSTTRKFYSGEIPFIGSGDIKSEFVNKFITNEALESSSAKIVEKGDLLYALYGATSGEVAISKIQGAINQAVLCIRSSESIDYLFQILLHKKEQILATYLQGGQGNLSAQIVKKLKIGLPSLEEQQKIANFLSTLDKKLEAVQKQIDQIEIFKKGLLQKMFV